MAESEIERQYRDMRILGIGGGTTEILTAWPPKSLAISHDRPAQSTLDPDVDRPTPRRPTAMAAKLAEIDAELAKALGGGGAEVRRTPSRPRQADRPRTHRAAGRRRTRRSWSCARWPPTAATSRSAPAWSPASAWSNGVECLIVANDPTVKGGTSNPWTLQEDPARQPDRAARTGCRVISLVESGGADLPTQKEIFIPGGQMFRDLTRLSAAGHPDHRAGVRQLHRRRRLHPRDVRPRGDDQGTLEGLPGRPAAGEDGHRRGVRRRVAGRGRDARPQSRVWPTTSPSTSSTRSASAAASWPG